MTMFLILAPYGAFSLLLFVTTATISLFAAVGICLVAIVTDAVRGRSIKLLAAGSAMLFAGLGLYLLVWHPTWSNSAVSIAVDTGWPGMRNPTGSALRLRKTKRQPAVSVQKMASMAVT